jgi:hypothetical protein
MPKVPHFRFVCLKFSEVEGRPYITPYGPFFQIAWMCRWALYVLMVVEVIIWTPSQSVYLARVAHLPGHIYLRLSFPGRFNFPNPLAFRIHVAHWTRVLLYTYVFNVPRVL